MDSSDDESFLSESESDEEFDDSVVDDLSENKLEKLKCLGKNVNWEIEEERRKFLREFYSIINGWNAELPNLRDIFEKEEIHWLLMETVHFRGGDAEYFQREDIVDFVALTGYRDEPDVDDDGKPVLRRTTPVHEAAQRDYLHVVKSLFKIYDRFDANYIDEESGLTHFHVACMSRCDEVVEKFLELGQDPDLRVPRTGDSSLHLASARYNVEAIALLLKHGAIRIWPTRRD
ncbi:NF-kappa-B inhibitor alpha-like [Trichogramma pretiosum]|uniref:NF-kappa-B inhibitor alpha-like n=1 Tax=Trichogramma pretiosum TaxID=7493 RepID=UPI0006C969D7|nr:NF-kappa-B inhibitor alpha-like [Trichogramma pretiosum]